MNIIKIRPHPKTCLRYMCLMGVALWVCLVGVALRNSGCGCRLVTWSLCLTLAENTNVLL